MTMTMHDTTAGVPHERVVRTFSGGAAAAGSAGAAHARVRPAGRGALPVHGAATACHGVRVRVRLVPQGAWRTCVLTVEWLRKSAECVRETSKKCSLCADTVFFGLPVWKKGKGLGRTRAKCVSLVSNVSGEWSVCARMKRDFPDCTVDCARWPPPNRLVVSSSVSLTLSLPRSSSAWSSSAVRGLMRRGVGSVCAPDFPTAASRG